MIYNWTDENTYRLLNIIGESVKTRRLQRNISQIELSKLSGISLNSITRFETGKGNITLYSLINIFYLLIKPYSLYNFQRQFINYTFNFFIHYIILF